CQVTRLLLLLACTVLCACKGDDAPQSATLQLTDAQPDQNVTLPDMSMLHDGALLRYHANATNGWFVSVESDTTQTNKPSTNDTSIEWSTYTWDTNYNSGV